jgi:hypothetical protein
MMLPWGWQHLHLIDTIEDGMVYDRDGEEWGIREVILLGDEDIRAMVPTKPVSPKQAGKSIQKALAACNDVLLRHGHPKRYEAAAAVLDDESKMLFIERSGGKMDVWYAWEDLECFLPIAFDVARSAPLGTAGIVPGSTGYLVGELLDGNPTIFSVKELSGEGTAKVHVSDTEEVEVAMVDIYPLVEA